MNSSQSLNDPEYCHELDMSKCIIVLELTLQNIIYLPWYTETSTLCTKTVYGGAHENFYKVKFNCGSPNAAKQNKTRRQIPAQCRSLSQRGCSFHCHKG